MCADTQVAPPPTNELRIITRDETEEEKRERERDDNNQKLSERSRALALGIVAVVWGIMVGETKLAHTLPHHTKVLLVVSAGLSIFALVADYFEYSSGYLDNYLVTTSFFKFGRMAMFAIKQFATAASVVVLAFAVAALLWPVPAAATSPTLVGTIWIGSAWPDSAPDQKSNVRLYITSVDAFDASVKAQEGGERCEGKLLNVSLPPGLILKLRCGPLTILDGTITTLANGKRVYAGKYSSEVSTGQFCFKFGRNQ